MSDNEHDDGLPEQDIVDSTNRLMEATQIFLSEGCCCRHHLALSLLLLDGTRKSMLHLMERMGVTPEQVAEASKKLPNVAFEVLPPYETGGPHGAN